MNFWRMLCEGGWGDVDFLVSLVLVTSFKKKGVCEQDEQSVVRKIYKMSVGVSVYYIARVIVATDGALER